MKKRYVDVVLFVTKDGTTMPRQVYWNADRVYDIDKVLDVRPAASLKAGGIGVRYTVKIKGKETYLFLEEDKWFVEEK